jgi:hypothetical protein
VPGRHWHARRPGTLSSESARDRDSVMRRPAGPGVNVGLVTWTAAGRHESLGRRGLGRGVTKLLMRPGQARALTRRLMRWRLRAIQVAGRNAGSGSGFSPGAALAPGAWKMQPQWQTRTRSRTVTRATGRLGVTR